MSAHAARGAAGQSCRIAVGSTPCRIRRVLWGSYMPRSTPGGVSGGP